MGSIVFLNTLFCCKDRKNMNTKQVILPFFWTLPPFFYVLPFFLRIERKKSPGATESTRGFLSFNCNNHYPFNTQHSTLLNADFLAILDIDTLRWNIWYSATVEVIQCRLGGLIIQSDRIDT